MPSSHCGGQETTARFSVEPLYPRNPYFADDDVTAMTCDDRPALEAVTATGRRSDELNVAEA
jgi:hypothetical protein